MATNTIEKRPTTIQDNTAHRFGNYNTTVLRYPNDVSLSQAQQNYVMFYINTPEGTKTILDGEKILGVVASDGNNVNFDNAHTEVVGGVVGAGLGGAATLSMLKAITAAGGAKVGAVMGGLALTAGTVVGAGLGAGAAGQYVAQKSQYNRISDAIVLGLANVPGVSYNATWEDVELGTLGGIMAGGASSVDASWGATGSDMAKLVLRNAVKIPGSAKSLTTATNLAGGVNPGGAIAGITKEVANPFREQIFKQVGFRTFQFQYVFLPSSKEETERVKSIIEKFVFHMHPDLSDTGVFFKFPSQFNIVYYFKDKENPYLRKISTCVLEKCDIKYGADGSKFASFVNGAPVEVFMNLTFKETEILSKNRIKSGF